jgi:hypothetical protein
MDVAALGRHFDALSPERRVFEALELDGRAQAALFDAAAGFKAMALDDLVPSGLPPMTGVPHDGRNSLAFYSRFAKVFAKPDDPGLPELWGYNEGYAVVKTVVGPGYFVCVPHSVRGELLVDYLRQPPRAPAGWPHMLPNDARLSKFVFNGTQDVLRGVSRHVSIGRASRGGKWLDNWFVLVRREPG